MDLPPPAVYSAALTKASGPDRLEHFQDVRLWFLIPDRQPGQPVHDILAIGSWLGHFGIEKIFLVGTDGPVKKGLGIFAHLKIRIGPVRQQVSKNNILPARQGVKKRTAPFIAREI